MAITQQQTPSFFETRRKELRRDRYLTRLHRQPLMTQTRRARFEAIEHHGNALGRGQGIEFYDCIAEERGVENAHRPQPMPVAQLLERCLT